MVGNPVYTKVKHNSDQDTVNDLILHREPLRSFV
jgi:hypothetical protein